MVLTVDRIKTIILHLLRLKKSDPYKGIDADIKYYKQKLARMRSGKELR